MKKKQKKAKSKAHTLKDLKLAVIESTDLPKEIMLGLPLLTIIGTREVRIENFKNIIEFSEEKIRISTSSGILKIEGKSLVLSEINSKSISISGSILKYDFS